MKYRNRIITLLITAGLSVSSAPLSAQNSTTIVETADSAGVFTTLLAAVEAAGLSDWVDNSVPKTVFAPTDDAFAALPEGTVASLLEPENLPMLRQIIRYHLVSGVATSDQLSNGWVTTQSQAGLKVNIDNGVVLNDTVNVTTADIGAKNGVIHIVDGVLLPPEMNLVDRVANDPDLSTLAAALEAGDLLGILRNGRPYTVFAPTNAAFDALPEGTLDSLLEESNLSTLQNILLFHVTGQSLFSNNLSDGPIAMANGGSITVDTSGPLFWFNGNAASPVSVDGAANNGVVHKIDTVLLPPEGGIVEWLAQDGRFTTLIAAVEAAELVDALTGLSGATLFAPTNDAFNALPAGMVQQLLQPENKELLQNVLLYHLLSGNWYAADLGTNVYPTLTGVDLPVWVQDGTVTVDFGPQVIEANNLAANGVVHVIDGVILPPLNIADTLGQWDNYSTLVAALNAAGLFDVLNGAGPFTLFAPDNDAFAKLAPGTVEELLKPENLETLQSILLAHVVQGKVNAGELLAGTVTTMQGKVINVHWVDGKLMIGDEATITRSDFPAWNGTIQQIDTVLMP